MMVDLAAFVLASGATFALTPLVIAEARRAGALDYPGAQKLHAEPVPTLGGIARVYVVPMVAITGEFTGISITRDDFEAKFFDFDINGTVSFGRHLGAQAGYRSVVVDYLSDEDSGDLKMKGPYFGGVVRF